MRHGITPVVAIVLLLMMTVAAAGGAYSWLQQVQGTAQDRAGDELGTRLDVQEIRCSGSRAVIGVKNNGDRALVEDMVTAFISADGDLVATRETNVSGTAFLQPGGFDTVYVTFPAVLDAGRTYTVELVLENSDVSVTTPCDAGSAGLVGYWTFDQNDRDGTNGPYHDLAGSNDGTWNDANVSNGDGDSNAQLVAGVIGDAVAFDGTDDYVELTRTLSDYESDVGPMSASLWVNPSALPAEQSRIFGDGFGWEFGLNADGTPRIFGDLYGDTGYTSISTGNWYHVALVNAHDGSSLADTTFTVYVNGSQVGQRTVDLTGSNGYIETFFLGGDGGDPSIPNDFFDGAVDEVRLFNRAITAREVTELYEAGR